MNHTPGPGAGQHDPQQTAVVYLANATMTSAGHGPGAKRLPVAEASALVRRKLAVYGAEPPRGFHRGPW